MKKYLTLVFAFVLAFGIPLNAQYQFKMDKNIDCTSVKSQDRTGTCWSFATTSFLESELLRMGKGSFDLSEMYSVRTIYQDKARNYILRQGKANFSQGSLAHDVIRAFKMGGAVPESVYSGILAGDKMHNHSEMEAALKGLLDGIITRKSPGPKWQGAFTAVVDHYLGEGPSTFTYEGKSYTPESFADMLDINPDDYISLSSYAHHPFYEKFILEIPDNYSNGSYYNLPIGELQDVAEHAIANGYTISWDGDVSEKSFSQGKGIAVIPADKMAKYYDNPVKEEKVDQDLRQKTFENYSTTDDHLMHLTGTAHDQNGTRYYLIKNSWGESGSYKGFLHMSSAYFRLKTVGILVHKDAVPRKIAEKLGIK